MTVHDASAVLAFVKGEAGAALADDALLAGATVSAANWSQVHQKCLDDGRDWPATRDGLLSHDLIVAPVDMTLAEAAAEQWLARPSLSLADRCCLALGEAEGAPVLTSDRAWGTEEPVVQIR